MLKAGSIGAVTTAGFLVVLGITGCAATTSAPSDTTAATSSGSSTEPGALDPLVQAELDGAWERTGMPASERPEVEVVRYSGLLEMPDIMAACMRERGWDVVSEGGGWGGSGDSGLAEEQLGPYWYDAYVCNAQYPTDPKYLRPFDAEQLDRLYDFYDTELRQCIEDHGQTMTELPSRRKFVEDYYRMTWDPTSDAGRAIGNTPAGAHELERLRNDCSSIPPSDSEVWG